MPTEFRFPDVGEGITEGEILKWLVKEGDAVNEHDAIAEIETDKAIVEIPSPVSGFVLRLAHKQGETVKVGDILAVIGKSSEKTAVVGQPEAKQENHALAAPAVRKLAKEMDVDIDDVRGTGKDGRVTDEDVKNYKNVSIKHEDIKQPEIKVARKYDMYGYIERIQLKGIRKATAEKMSRSVYTAPHVTHMDEADVTELYIHKEREKEYLMKKGVHLTYLPFVIKACVKSLKDHQFLNASIEDNEIILKKYYNIGIAIDIENGLLAPVIKGADQKSIVDIAKELQELEEKAKNRKLDLADMKGGTFTITNVGSIGGLYATPIINYPEVSILALGRVYDRPVVMNNRIIIRKVMPLSLAFDHRVLDGAEAAKFVSELKSLLEDPDKLMLEK